jgi:hypothetical protein
MNRWRVGEDRGSKEMDGCPLTDEDRLNAYRTACQNHAEDRPQYDE